MYKIIQIATKELGVVEFPSVQDNPRILQYATETGLVMSKGDETPWCSIFMNWVAKEAGFLRSHSSGARSWLDVGFKVKRPELGDLIVYWREAPNSWKGHVGIFFGYTSNRKAIYTLGGNQGNAVSITTYPVERFLEFRRLIKEDNSSIEDIVSSIPPANTPSAPPSSNKELKVGDSGLKVAELQDFLKMAGYEAGVSDGIFGPTTDKAVRKLQEHAGLRQTGIFTLETKDYLQRKLLSINDQYVYRGTPPSRTRSINAPKERGIRKKPKKKVRFDKDAWEKGQK